MWSPHSLSLGKFDRAKRWPNFHGLLRLLALTRPRPGLWPYAAPAAWPPVQCFTLLGRDTEGMSNRLLLLVAEEQKNAASRVDPRHVQDSSPLCRPSCTRGHHRMGARSVSALRPSLSLNWVIFFIHFATHSSDLMMVWTCIAASPHPSPHVCAWACQQEQPCFFFCLAHQRQHSWYSSPAATSGHGPGTVIGTPVFSLSLHNTYFAFCCSNNHTEH